MRKEKTIQQNMSNALRNLNNLAKSSTLRFIAKKIIMQFYYIHNINKCKKKKLTQLFKKITIFLFKILYKLFY